MPFIGALLSGLLLWYSLGVAHAGNPSCRWSAASESSLSVEGDSTLHKYSLKTRSLTAEGESNPVSGKCAAGDLLEPGVLHSLKVRIPVSSLKSGDDGLDENMLEALNAKAYPEIVFDFSTYAAGGAAEGMLIVNGTERPVTLQVKPEAGNETLRVRGTHEMKMSDFKVKPPTFFLGVLATDDKITIHFDLILKQGETP